MNNIENTYEYKLGIAYEDLIYDILYDRFHIKVKPHRNLYEQLESENSLNIEIKYDWQIHITNNFFIYSMKCDEFFNNYYKCGIWRNLNDTKWLIGDLYKFYIFFLDRI